jgi:maleylacetate reductase
MSMTTPFSYEALPMRVIFGAGQLEAIAAEVEQLGLRRVMVLSTPRGRDLAQRVADLLGPVAVGIFDGARMHVPVETAAAAGDAVNVVGADGCVAIGGGSTIGLGKALALRNGLPIIAVPTTYAGSEMTPVWGLTENSRKQTGRDIRVLPRSVIYDPELTVALPQNVSGTSGLNAIAHAVEALYAPDRSPIMSLLAEDGVRSLARSLPRVVADGSDLDARSDALRGAWFCGACLGATTMGLHHKICHVLGGTFDLPHAETHAVVLPYVAAMRLAEEPDAAAAMRRALETDSPAQALADLAAWVGAPTSLAELGLQEADLDVVVEAVLANQYSKPVAKGELETLLRRALHGGPDGPTPT